MRLSGWLGGVVALVGLFGCGPDGSPVMGQAKLPPVGEVSPVPEVGGDAVDCEGRVAPEGESAPTVVVVAAADDPTLRRSLEMSAGLGERVLLVGYGPQGSADVLLAADLAGHGGSEVYRDADAATRARCFSALASRAVTELDDRPGAALTALPSAIAQGRQVAAGGELTVLIHQAGEMHESGLALADVDLGSHETVSELVDDIIAGGLLDVELAASERLVFVDVARGAENGLVAVHRREFFAALCEATPFEGTCKVVEEVSR